MDTFRNGYAVCTAGGVVTPVTELGNVHETEFDAAPLTNPVPLYPLKAAYAHIVALLFETQSPGVPAVNPADESVTPLALTRRSMAPAWQAASAAAPAAWR
jgi:hypothetical protein